MSWQLHIGHKPMLYLKKQKSLESKQKILFLLKRKEKLKKLVTNKTQKLPPEIVNHWPEVFNDVEIRSVPIDYINNINVFFNNGKIFTIDVRLERHKYEDTNSLEESLDSFFKQYDNVIKSIDFSIDTPKVKQDIQKRTKTFLKKHK
jgi:deoxyadenosine/deoxycytidine kinase